MKSTRQITPEEAIERLEGWQNQIVDGPKPFQEIADLIREMHEASFNDVSHDIARMVTEYVEGGIKLGTDWRNGLPEIIAKRLKRLQDSRLPVPSDNNDSTASIKPKTNDWAEPEWTLRDEVGENYKEIP